MALEKRWVMKGRYHILRWDGFLTVDGPMVRKHFVRKSLMFGTVAVELFR